MKCTACGNECFEDEIYPQAVFWNDEKCICEECSIDFEEINGVIQFRQDLIDDGCVEPVFKEKTMELLKMSRMYGTKGAWEYAKI